MNGSNGLNVKTRNFARTQLGNAVLPKKSALEEQGFASRVGESFAVEIEGQRYSFNATEDPYTSQAANNLIERRLGISAAIGDPNLTTPHTDVIRTALLAKIKDESLPLEDRETALATFKQMYPPSSDASALTDLQRRGVSFEVQAVTLS